MMIFVDTHCHIDLDAFDKDRDLAISRAVNAGVTSLLIPNIDASGIRNLVSVTVLHPGICFPMMGLHPTSVKADYREQMGTIEMELRQNRDRYVAVGEIGIDLYWDKTFAREQEDVFVRQLELADEFDLPVAIHTRNSLEITLEICEGRRTKDEGRRTKDEGRTANSEKQKANSEQRTANCELRTANNNRLRGVFHCFSGNLRQAERAIELGFMLGIGGVITFRNSGLQQVVQTVDLKYLLLETDAPFLAPVPHRGQRNEPAYIPFIAEKVAELKRISMEEVAEVTTRSALELFG